MKRSGGHFCWSSHQHLHPLVPAQPRPSHKDKVSFSAHVGVCRSARGHSLRARHQKHAESSETAHIYHNTGDRDGYRPGVWRLHHAHATVPQNQVGPLFHPFFTPSSLFLSSTCSFPFLPFPSFQCNKLHYSIDLNT